MNSLFHPLLLAGTFLCSAVAVCGQAAPGPIAPRPGTKQETAPLPQAKNVKKINVIEVSAPVVVHDSKGEMILDLAQKDFHVFDNSVEQKIDHFDLGGDPLAIALVVEASSRVEALLPEIRKSGIIFSETVMGQTGEAAVVSYDDTVDVRQSFTTDPDSIQSAIAHLRMGTSGARLYDAMAKGVTLLEKEPPRNRRIMVVLGEAVDTGSEAKLGEALRTAQLANISIYTVGLSTTAAEFRHSPKQYKDPQLGPPGTFPIPTPNGIPETPENEARNYGSVDLLSLAVWAVMHLANVVHDQSLGVAATATGGMHIRTFKDRSIENALDAIGGELHAEYTLAYRPSGRDVTGYHEIKVTVDRPGVKVRTRPGYYIAPPSS